MNQPLVLDTSAYVSLGSISDSNYKAAIKISNTIQETGRSVIVPSDVFTEIINVVGKKGDHNRAIIQGEQLLSSRVFTIVESTPSIRQNALGVFKQQPKSVSFSDCIVMATADHFDTKEIFGFDDVFRKNGYIRFGIDKSKK